MILCKETAIGMTDAQIDSAFDALLESLHKPLRRVLLIPPDITRFHSYAGILTRKLYERLEPVCHCDILPAVGTHMAMDRKEQITFFGENIPEDRFIRHAWRTDTVSLGTITPKEAEAITDGLLCEEIPVEVNKNLTDEKYDHIFSIGQVVPHEVVGMANFTKNILVGCGGSRMISLSHLLGVLYGTEESLGCDHTPVRRLFDYAQEHFISALPLTYILTVTKTDSAGKTELLGLYAGQDRECFTKAVKLSQRVNIVHMEKPIRKCVVYLEPEEFRTSWLGNKSVYRTRKALAPDAQLLILAPGFCRFGEDELNDRLIRKYGYMGSKEVLAAMQTTPELRQNLSVVAHIAQGSSDGHFTITYLTDARYADEVRSVGYTWQDVQWGLRQYAHLPPGWNTVDGEEIYYIANPALGLWVYDGKTE